MTFTHAKRPYRARALQWDGENTSEVIGMLTDGEARMYGTDYIMVRHDTGVATIRKGWWVLVGEDGKTRVYSPERFDILYEPLTTASQCPPLTPGSKPEASLNSDARSSLPARECPTSALTG